MAKPIYSYPESLREAANTASQPYMSFQLKHDNNPNNMGQMVFLYLPKALSVSDGASYTGVDLGSVKALRSLKSDGPPGSGTQLSESDVAAKSIELAGNIGGTLEAAATELGMNRGVALNPFTNLAFEGMSPRTFQFEFQFVSESKEEAETIKWIENWFRKNMYAETAGVFSLKYPPMLRTQFWDGESESEFLPMIMDSFITGLSVTYNDSNQMYHDDGAPVETNLSLSISESKTLTRNDLYGTGLKYYRKGRDGMQSDATDTESDVNEGIKQDTDKKKQEEKDKNNTTPGTP
jgi:hypothetical protein